MPLEPNPLPTDLATLSAATQQLLVAYEESSQRTDELNERFKGYVTVRAGAVIVALIVFVVGVALVLGLSFRAQDRRDSRERIRQETREKEVERSNLLAGCGRANDQRAWGRRLIERAYVPLPVPDGLSAELRDLYVQSQERQAAQRAEQLADPGVQVVNCEAAFPPVAAEK